MSSRKRSFRVVDSSPESGPSLLHRIRNMWQFANLCQWIYTFGKAAKIDESLDIEEIEVECLKPSSIILDDIALAILKLVSSHRGLTHEIFDEQARRQYLRKAPERNPFGDDEVPSSFSKFDIFTKIRVLQQLTQWTMAHPERIREKMEEQKDIDQTSWRIEPYGWDARDRTYFVLDDNRVYRLTEPPPPAPKPKRTKTWRSGRRSSKRRRTTLSMEEQQSDAEGDLGEENKPEDDGLGGMTWECVAVALGDVQSLLDEFRKTRDENERILRRQLEDHLLPILQKQEETRKRKEVQRERELMNLAKMANAKRSSRIANKAEQQKQEQRAREEDEHRRVEEAMQRREEAARLRVEKERDRRMVSREQRLREREARRVQHEDELAQLSEDSKHTANGNGRISERRLLSEIERNKQALKDLEEEEEDWVFDCVCGLYGQVDDGTHSVACERCNVWQHSKCLGINEEDAERPEFQFVCSSCIRREQEANARPRPTIKLRVHHHHEASGAPAETNQTRLNGNSLPGIDSVGVASSTSKETGRMLLQDHQTEARPASGNDGVADKPVVNGASTLNKWPNEALPEFKARKQDDNDNMAHGASVAVKDVVQSPNLGSPQPRSIISTMASSSPAGGLHTLQGDPVIESALSTPKISRDIYRAAYLQNGTLPAAAGISPTKHSPPRPIEPSSGSKINTTTPILPPVTNLSPSPQRLVLTPPSKSSEPIRLPESR